MLHQVDAQRTLLAEEDLMVVPAHKTRTATLMNAFVVLALSSALSFYVDRTRLFVWLCAVLVIETALLLSRPSTKGWATAVRSSVLGATVGAVVLWTQPANEYEIRIMCVLCVVYLLAFALSRASSLIQFGFFAVSQLVMFVVGFVSIPDIARFADIFLLSLATAMASFLFRFTQQRDIETERLSVRNIELIESLRFRADHDELTGLLNRNATLAALNERLCLDRNFIALRIDLDNFKFFNDQHGTTAGDDYLIQLAGDLEATSGAKVVGRIEGDGFVLIFDNDGASPEQQMRACSAIVHEIVDNLQTKGVVVSCSIGVMYVTADDCRNADDISQSLQAAVTEVKSNGGADTTIFDDTMRADVEQQDRTRRDVVHGLANGEFVPYIQPVVDIRTGQLTGGEVLARWIRDGREIPACDFIDAAKRGRLLNDIDQAMYEQVSVWRRAHPELNKLDLAINVGPDRLHAAGQRFAKLSNDRDLDGLVFEMTERGIVANPDTATQQLNEWRERGARIFLDDFGTGFSSLELLTSLPIDGLKIDRKFVQGATDGHRARAIVAATVELARRLNLELVAEGIETTQEAHLMRDMGVTIAQGWLFLKAVPLDQFTALATDNYNWRETLHASPMSTSQVAPLETDTKLNTEPLYPGINQS